MRRGPLVQPRGLAVFDMDRTLTQAAVAHAVSEALGVREKVKALSGARSAGELSQQDVTLGIARLLAGMRVEDFARVVAAIPLTLGSREAVARLRGEGVGVALCSDSFSRAAEPLAKRLGIPLFAANVLEEQEGAFTGALLPWGPALGLGASQLALDKREAVPFLAKAARVPLQRTAVIGDGDQDALAMGLVGLGISFQGTPKARAAAKHHLEGNLGPAATLVLEWLAALPR